MIDAYTDYRRYVVEALDRMGRSRREFAAALDLSFSMLSQVLSRKRKIRPTLVPVMAEFFGLDLEGEQVLAALVDLDNESARARETAWAVIQARQRYLARDNPTDDVIEVMATWYVAAVYELAACDGFRAEPEWIAQTMNPSITVDQAQHAINTLLRSGMFEPDGDGGLRQAQTQVWTEQKIPRGRQADAMYKLQLDLLARASDCYTRFRTNERHNSAWVAALSEERYQRVVTRVQQMEQELLHLLSEPGDDVPNRVFQMTTNLFPVTDYSDNEYPSGSDDPTD